jgi:hypothetical protein
MIECRCSSVAITVIIGWKCPHHFADADDQDLGRMITVASLNASLGFKVLPVGVQYFEEN